MGRDRGRNGNPKLIPREGGPHRTDSERSGKENAVPADGVVLSDEGVGMQCPDLYTCPSRGHTTIFTFYLLPFTCPSKTM